MKMTQRTALAQNVYDLDMIVRLLEHPQMSREYVLDVARNQLKMARNKAKVHNMLTFSPRTPTPTEGTPV
jgi:hypothetical protein